MGTRAKIKIENEGRYVCSTYYNMDGHVENWAPLLIKALKQTSPKSILKNSRLFRFMCDDDEGEEFLDYLCKIGLSNNTYHITLYGYNKTLIFEGTLAEFSEKYKEID